MFKTLGISDGGQCTFRLLRRPPVGRRVTLQLPQSFGLYLHPRTTVARALVHFKCLTEGDAIVVHAGGRDHTLVVDSVEDYMRAPAASSSTKSADEPKGTVCMCPQ